MPDIEHRPIPPRRRGAPLGNTNALKYGYYSRRALTTDLADLHNHNFAGLAEEIAILRVFIRRLVDRAAQETTLVQDVDLMRTLCLAMLTLTRLLRAEMAMSGSAAEAEFRQAIDNALLAAQKDFGII